MREFESGMDLSGFLDMRPDADDLAWEHAMDISASVYSRLKELGMSQKDLAEKMGVTAGRVSQIIKGYPGMSLKILAKIEEALDFDLGGGFTYLPAKPNRSSASSQHVTRHYEDSLQWSDKEREQVSKKLSRFECIDGGLAA